MPAVIHAVVRLLAFCLLAMAPLPGNTEDAPHVTVQPIPDDVWSAMQGVSWHATLGSCKDPAKCTCPPREALSLLTIPYRTFGDDAVRIGRMIVAASVANAVSRAMQAIVDSGRYRFQEIKLVDAYGGDDDRSMAANNTSAFNCRLTTGGTSLSAHSYGTAIDINPVQNPYVKGSLTLPPAGKAFDEAAERTADVPGVIVADDVVVEAFRAIGWKWGGDWTSLKDYQHFSADGR